ADKDVDAVVVAPDTPDLDAVSFRLSLALCGGLPPPTPPGLAPRARLSVCWLGRRPGLALGPRLGGQQGGHPPPFHCARALQLTRVRQLLQDQVEDPPPFLLVLHFATAEQDGDQHLVLALQELARLAYLDVHVVFARLGADADLLHLRLANLATLVALLLRILETHLAVVEDAADRRAVARRPPPQGAVPLPGPPPDPRRPP